MKREGAALGARGLQIQGATHRLGQLAAQVQPQAGPRATGAHTDNLRVVDPDADHLGELTGPIEDWFQAAIENHVAAAAICAP